MYHQLAVFITPKGFFITKLYSRQQSTMKHIIELSKPIRRCSYPSSCIYKPAYLSTFSKFTPASMKKKDSIDSHNGTANTISSSPTSSNPHIINQSHIYNMNETLLKKFVREFSDTSSIYNSKSNLELFRAYMVFKICRIHFAVTNSKKLIDLSYKVLGKNLTNYILKISFFGHFCAGENAQEIKPKISQLQRAGIGAILDYAAEADVGLPRDLNGVRPSQISARTYDYLGEKECDKNAKISYEAVCAASSSKNGFTAIKCTALGQPELLERMSSIIVDVQKLFQSLNSPDLSRKSISVSERMVDSSTFIQAIRNANCTDVWKDEDIVSLFETMDVGKDGKINYYDWISFLDPMELTMGSLTSFLQVPPLSSEEIQRVKNLIQRLEMLASAANEKNVRLMIDAEQTYLQPAIDHLALNLQRKYNRKESIIFNTFQCYLKDCKDRMLVDLDRAHRENFQLGVKLVRGAYMVQERKRAFERGLEDPIHSSIEATHNQYNEMVSLLLDNNKRISLMMASHNEQSTLQLCQLMEEKQISKESGGIYFGQLLGMCDHVSYSLGKMGYQVYKYVPYGPIEQVLPYLIRRAEENSGLLTNVDREMNLLKREIKSRLLLLFHR